MRISCFQTCDNSILQAKFLFVKGDVVLNKCVFYVVPSCQTQFIPTVHWISCGEAVLIDPIKKSTNQYKKQKQETRNIHFLRGHVSLHKRCQYWQNKFLGFVKIPKS